MSRKLWHDLFYVATLGLGPAIGLRCESVTRSIDLGTVPDVVFGKLRFELHLGICQACYNYLRMGLALKQWVGTTRNPNLVELNFVKLNRDLIEKHRLA